MARIQQVSASSVTANAHHLAPTCEADGPVESRLVSPSDASLWLVTSTLPAGTTLSWDTAHGDEAVYVCAGSLTVEGRECPSGGALVIEADVATRAHAKGPTRVIHLGPRDPTPPAGGLRRPAGSAGHSVHVVGPRGTFERVDDDRETRFFADSTCPTCRLWLLYTSRSCEFESQTHSHSQDELIHVLHGEIALGSLRLGPGATLFIAADQPYGFRAAAGGFGFLNYRRDASEMSVQGQDGTLVESGETTGMQPVSDLR